MKKYLLHYFLFLKSVLVVCLIVLQTGCHSANTVVLKKNPSLKQVSIAKSVETKKQNLSMAKKLKNQPISEYILGPEDVVEISVLGHEELKMEVSISPTGKIPYYFIGDVQAAGLSQFQLRDNIQKEIAEFIKDPKVVVHIKEHRSHKVFVLGQVKNPGVYRIRSEMTLLEAISSSGGVTSDAYLGGAYLVRDSKILLVNFFELIKQGNTGENVPLLPGDIIYIPDKKDHKIYILGEVNKQSTIPIEEGLTLLGAITQAGGFTRDANKKSIVLLRGNLSEPEIMMINMEQIWKRRRISTEQIMNGHVFMANIPLERGDIIYIPSRFIADVERIAVRLSNILDPLLKVERGILYGDAVVDVFEGADTRFIIGE